MKLPTLMQKYLEVPSWYWCGTAEDAVYIGSVWMPKR